MARRNKKGGWYKHPDEHALASRGIKTRSKENFNASVGDKYDYDDIKRAFIWWGKQMGDHFDGFYQYDRIPEDDGIPEDVCWTEDVGWNYFEAFRLYSEESESPNYDEYDEKYDWEYVTAWWEDLTSTERDNIVMKMYNIYGDI